jgi:hypothetical protein
LPLWSNAAAAEQIKDSKTTFAADAINPYITSGELPGLISVFYQNGIQETACLG